MEHLDHSKGFEKEKKISQVFAEVSDVEKSLYKWDAFFKVAKIINPELCDGVYVSRPCIRKLRYIGKGGKYFVPGNIYNSTEFNGATYLIEEYSDLNDGRRIGCAYFEVVED